MQTYNTSIWEVEAEEDQEFKVILDYTASLRPVWVTCLNNKQVENTQESLAGSLPHSKLQYTLAMVLSNYLYFFCV